MLLLSIRLLWVPLIAFAFAAISLAVAAALVIAVGRDPLEVVDALWKGAQRQRASCGVVNFWIPLTLVSIGLVHTAPACGISASKVR